VVKVETSAAQDADKNDPKSRWRRGVFLAGRLQDGNSIFTNQEDGKGEPKHTKALATQHWLELVDP
jgi:hypothetical protein